MICCLNNVKIAHTNNTLLLLQRQTLKPITSTSKSPSCKDTILYSILVGFTVILKFY